MTINISMPSAGLHPADGTLMLIVMDVFIRSLGFRTASQTSLYSISKIPAGVRSRIHLTYGLKTPGLFRSLIFRTAPRDTLLLNKHTSIGKSSPHPVPLFSKNRPVSIRSLVLRTARQNRIENARHAYCGDFSAFGVP